MDDILEEIEVIRTIYCHDGEVVVQQKGPDMVISVHVQSSASIEVILTTSISPDTYPSSPPLISIKSLQLTRTQCEDIKKMVIESCKQFVGEPMLFHIISSLSDHIESTHVEMNMSELDSQQNTAHPIPITTCLLQLDHMRNKQQYSKTVIRWAEKLDLVGRLMFCHKIILILLQGSKEAVKEYVHRNRSQAVDVDSRGKPCKERLLSILFNYVVTDQKTYQEFTCCDFLSLDAVKRNLKEHELIHLSQQLETLIKR